MAITPAFRTLGKNAIPHPDGRPGYLLLTDDELHDMRGLEETLGPIVWTLNV
jgi:hypothetical protein